MDNRLVDFADQLRELEDIESIWLPVEKFFSDLGFSAVNYGLIEKTSGEMLGFCTNMDDSWMAHYIDSQFQYCDPWINHTRTHTKPALFSRGELNELLVCGGENEACLIRECSEVGLDRSFLIPFHNDLLPRIAGINLISEARHDEFMKLLDKDRWIVLIAAALANSHLTGLPIVGPTSYPWFSVQSETALLSPREVEVLKWLSEGYQNDRIAEKMNLAPVTVNFHLSSVKKKLGAKTREQALIIAVRKGYISV